MGKRYSVLVLKVLIVFIGCAQNKMDSPTNNMELSSEKIEVIIDTNKVYINNTFTIHSGYNLSHPIFYYKNNEDRRFPEISFIELNEKELEFSKLDRLYDSILTPYYNNFKMKNNLLFYTGLNFLSPSDYGYYKLFFRHNKRNIVLDSIYNCDKHIHSSFSSEGKYLLVNTLNTLSDYYNPEQDDRIMVYDLSDIENGNIKKEYIPCDKCSDSYLIGDTLFFTIGRKDAYNGFDNKDIYKAPFDNLEDTVKIADNTKIIAISPDGRYILGTRFFDREKTTCVIIDVKTKKYQMLLGRDYAKHSAFYSHYEQKFAFDFNGYIIYVDFPGSYPFDALKWKNEEIPDWTEEDFWKQFEHEPLPNK